MKKRLMALLIAVVMVMGLMTTGVLAAGEDQELTKLGTPTELQWGYRIEYVGGELVDYPGSLSWKAASPYQNQSLVCLYLVGNDETAVAKAICTTEATSAAEYLSIPLFVDRVESLDSGTYYFTVQALGDGINYSDSDIATSDTWTYTKPTERLPQVEVGSWEWPYFSWNEVEHDLAGTYNINIYFAASEEEEPYVFTYWTNVSFNVEELSDYYTQMKGPGYYYFSVQARSIDITQILNGPWSELSEAYHLEGMSQEDIQDALDDIDTESASESEIREAVQALPHDSLMAAMEADQGEEDGIIDRLKELEEKAGGAAEVEVDGLESFDQDKVSIVGANLNKENDDDEIKLVVGKTGAEKVVIPELYASTIAVSFSMELQKGETAITEQLAVPVQITLPIPGNINRDFLVILHFDQNGDYEVVRPYIFEKDNQWYASFVIDHFSDFAMTVELTEENSEAKIGDTFYATLAEAITAANDGGTITLLKDIELTSYILINSGEVAIDLNGKTITALQEGANAGLAFYVTGGSLTIQDSSDGEGQITQGELQSANMAAIIVNGANAALDIQGGTIQGIGSTTVNRAAVQINNGTMTMSGGAIKNDDDLALTVVTGTVTISGDAEISSNGSFAISTNGAQSADAEIIIEGGTITGSGDTCGIYLPAGTLTVSDGTISGGAGIVVMGGELEVTGGTITATGSDTVEVGDSGHAVPAAAVVVDQESSGYGESSAKLSGGTYRSDLDADIVYTVDGEENTDDVNGALVVDSSDATFSSPVDPAYLAEDLTVELEKSEGDAPYSYYSSVDEALEDAEAGDTIKDLSDPADEGSVVCTVEYDGEGVTEESVNVLEGDTVTLPAAPSRSGYTFNGWKSSADEETYAAGEAVVITEDTTFTAQWTKNSSSSTTTPTTPTEPDPEPEYENPYDDVDEESGLWYLDTVQYVTENGLMEGYDEGDEHLFGVGENITRAQLVQILYNMEGKPASDGECVFPDVNEDGWYVDAILWAAENGIVDGYEDGTFRPDDCITREETAAVLYRYAEYKGYDVSAEGDLSVFADAEAVSEWAAEYVTWAVGAGIILGHDDGTVAPQGSALREEAAAMLQRFHQNFVK